MTVPYSKGGCLLCGVRRKLNDIRNSSYDIYFTDNVGSKTKIGFCKTCFDANTFDYPTIKRLLCASEKGVMAEKQLPNGMTYWCSKTFVAHELVRPVE